MASAVLAGRSEQKWGDAKGFIKNYSPNRFLIHSSSNNFSHFGSRINQNTNPSFNASFPHAESSHFRQNNDPPTRRTPLARPPSSTETEMFGANCQVNGANDAYRRKFVTFDLASFSRYNLKGLKNRLISELRRVRRILKRIEAHEIESRPRFNTPLSPPPNPGGIPMVSAPPLKADNKTLKPDSKTSCIGSVAGHGNGGKVLGQKRVKTGAPVREAKRRAVGSPLAMVKVTTMRKCREALLKLMNLKSAVPFNRPVDVELLQLPDYNSIIRSPMDLGTIKLKLEKNRYRTPKAFAADVRLTFDNAMVYNHKGSKVYICAEKLLMRFEQLFEPIAKNYKAQFASVKESAKPVPKAFPGPMSVKEIPCNLQPVQPTGMNSSDLKVPMESIKPDLISMSERPISRSRDINKREMRFEEKQELVEQLQEMPPAVAARMVHVLREQNPNLMLEGDEIELDMEALDVETLWELQRFVTSYKNGSKMREQEQNENPGSDSDLKKMNKKGDEVDEDVDIGEEILVGNFPSVEIEKDVAGPNNSGSSSSSSSSDSDSPSSTDSDSSASSSSDSEEDCVHGQSPFVELTKDA